jgi:hypothetical protein
MAQEWHDVNDPGLFYKAKPAQQQQQQQQEEAAEEQSNEAEVKLTDGVFVVPAGGPAFNGKCKVQAKVEYLRETPRKKISFSLFSTYNSQTQDMKSSVDGFEKDGVAEAELTLFYNDAHYDDLENNPNATVDYYFKATHPRGQSELQSENLTMPYSGKQLVLRIACKDEASMAALDNDVFTLFSTDQKKSFNKKIVVKDASDAGNNTRELTFNALKEDLSYSLQVESGTDKIKYLLLNNVAFGQLSQAA